MSWSVKAASKDKAKLVEIVDKQQGMPASLKEAIKAQINETKPPSWQGITQEQIDSYGVLLSTSGHVHEGVGNYEVRVETIYLL